MMCSTYLYIFGKHFVCEFRTQRDHRILGAIATKCALCAGAVHRSSTLLVFRRTCAPQSVRSVTLEHHVFRAIELMRSTQ